MYRFYVTPDLAHGPVLTLSDREAHHAIHVLRIRAGERVVVLDGRGQELLCEVGRANGHVVELRVVQKHVVAPLPYKLTLIQAITKGKTMDLIVQKATELGVHRIVPVLSERTVSHLDGESGAAKGEKWRATAIEAIKQCGSPWLPEIELPLSPQAFLAKGEAFDLSLVATLQTTARHPRVYVRTFMNERQQAPKSVAVWVGPEGDFTPAETNAVIAAGALPITLGKLILRSETAAIYCMAMLNYELQAPAEL